MRKLFVCLANSRKYSGRCIAGVELSRHPDGFLKMVETPAHQPSWIRPVSQSEFGELSADWVRHIRLGDLIEVDVENKPITHGYQCENVYFDAKSLQIIEHLDLTHDRLKRLSIQENSLLFGGRGGSVPVDNLADVDNSLQFIKVEKAALRWRDEPGMRPQERLVFLYNDYEYDLPLTDIEFVEKYLKDDTILEKANDVFLTVSLSLPHDGRLYKLAAGVFLR
jgi:hypothetical protein